MSIALDDFLTEAGLDAYRAERRSRFEEIARDYLRKTFGPRLSLADDDALTRFVRRCQKQAETRGIETESELLRYFSVAVLWGAGFETDPQHRAALEEALWIDAAGKPLRVQSTGLLWEVLIVWNETMAEDLADTVRLRRAFASLYRQEGRVADAAWLAGFLQAAWPKRFASIPMKDWQTLADRVHEAAAPLELEGPDLMTVIGLAVYFGAGLLDEPTQPWIVAALAKDGRELIDRRLALGDGVMQFLQVMTDGETV